LLGVAAVLFLSGCAEKDPFGTANGATPSASATTGPIGDFGPGVPFPSAAPASPTLDLTFPSSAFLHVDEPTPTQVIVAPGGVAQPLPRRAVGTKAANSGSGSGGKQSGGTTTVTNPFIAASAAPTGPSVAAQVLTTADVGNGAHALTGPSDSTVAGGSSLSLCRGNFPSEGQRIARQYTTFDNDTGTTLATNEVVRYSSGGAAAAFDQLKAALAGCPKTGSGATTSVTPVPAALGSPTLELSIVLSPGSPGVFLTSIYQVVGDSLGITNVYRTDPAAAQGEAERLGAIEAIRLHAG
jgi:hypothetical protein